MASILGTQGVKPEMKFVCACCNTQYGGEEVINRSVDLFIIEANRIKPELSLFRCHLCQEDLDDE